MIVLDANVALEACAASDGFARFGREELVAPASMWAEARSGLHEAMWRGEIDRTQAEAVLERLEGSPIRARTHRRLGREAWRIANDLGWAKTYDAEYLALAHLLGSVVVTLDLRLRRGADRLGLVITPEEMGER